MLMPEMHLAIVHFFKECPTFFINLVEKEVGYRCHFVFAADFAPTSWPGLQTLSLNFIHMFYTMLLSWYFIISKVALFKNYF